jgi:hypothetical protein
MKLFTQEVESRVNLESKKINEASVEIKLQLTTYFLFISQPYHLGTVSFQFLNINLTTASKKSIF